MNYSSLIATTVIEVGVDAPNASIMVIENPERLGLSRLTPITWAVLVEAPRPAFAPCDSKSPLSQNGQERLRIMRETNDGFLIAKKIWKSAVPVNCSVPNKRVIGLSCGETGTR